MVLKRPDPGYEAAGLPADHNCYVLRAWHRTENAAPFTDSSTTVEDVATSVDEAVTLLRDKVLPTALALAKDKAAAFSDADGEAQLVLLEHEPFAGPLEDDGMDQMKKKKSRKRKCEAREAKMTPKEKEAEEAEMKKRNDEKEKKKKAKKAANYQRDKVKIAANNQANYQRDKAGTALSKLFRLGASSSCKQKVQRNVAQRGKKVLPRHGLLELTQAARN
jgi:hypothetical protein